MKHALCFIAGVAVGIIAGLVGQFFYRLWAVPVLPEPRPRQW